MRSAPELTSFNEFCESNPTLRFWQALSAWVFQAYEVDGAPDIIVGGHAYDDMIDTFFWEWEGEHPIGPGRRVTQVATVLDRMRSVFGEAFENERV